MFQLATLLNGLSTTKVCCRNRMTPKVSISDFAQRPVNQFLLDSFQVVEFQLATLLNGLSTTLDPCSVKPKFQLATLLNGLSTL